jgi:AcrR family transcriptional regulator
MFMQCPHLRDLSHLWRGLHAKKLCPNAHRGPTFLQNSTTVRFIPDPFAPAAVSTLPPLSTADVKSAAPDAARERAHRGAAHKGQQTRAAILEAALSLASQMGIEGLSIGALAEVTGMSKSGVFAHFGSREELQISVIREYHERFEAEVFYPALTQPRGLPRLRTLIKNWVSKVATEIESGCIYISGAVEFDDRPGPVRDALAGMVLLWHGALDRSIRQAIEMGQLRPDTDSMQLLFEIHGLVLSLHHDARFLRSPGAVDRARLGFERVIQFYALEGAARAPAGGVAPVAAKSGVSDPSLSSVDS